MSNEYGNKWEGSFQNGFSHRGGAKKGRSVQGKLPPASLPDIGFGDLRESFNSSVSLLRYAQSLALALACSGDPSGLFAEESFPAPVPCHFLPHSPASLSSRQVPHLK